MAGVFFSGTASAASSADDKKGDCGKAVCCDVRLNTAADSLSYAVGMVRTDGLIPFLKQSYGVDTAYMSDFIRGYNDAMAKGFSEEATAYYAGEQIAQMVSKRMLPFLKEEFGGRNDSINESMFNRGFTASLLGDMSLMADSTAKKYFDAAFKQAVDERNAATRQAGEDFLAANKQKDGVVTLPSGLQYEVLVKGTGEVPGENDEVTVKYEGRLIDGTVFDSSYERGDGTAKFRPNQVIKGWQEALTIMPVGSKWELYIPYGLAYGERQAGKIKPYSALVFTVELVGVKKSETAANGTGNGKANGGKDGRKVVPATKILPAKKK